MSDILNPRNRLRMVFSKVLFMMLEIMDVIAAKEWMINPSNIVNDRSGGVIVWARCKATRRH